MEVCFVIMRNDVPKHVVIGTLQDAEQKRAELAKADRYSNQQPWWFIASVYFTDHVNSDLPPL